MERVLYDGPDDQICHELAEATGGPVALEHGKTYQVNADLADSLVESSQHFHRVGAPSLDELRARAAELGVEGANKLNKQAAAAAIAEAEAAITDSAGITDADAGDGEPEVSPDA